MTGMEVIAAAGAVPWRRTADGIEVALVHRSHYDDWSWPKGKLDDGENWPVAAVREVAEETGLRIALGRPLPSARYEIAGAVKEVRYWGAEAIGGHGRLDHEVDAVRWLGPPAARARLSYERDRVQLDALLDRAGTGGLATRPFLLVRHAKALPRRRWSRADECRPLDDRGHGQAAALAGLLSAYHVDALVSSSSTRCVQTFEPAAAALGRAIEREGALGEESFVRHPKRAVAAFTSTLARPDVVALCTHGPLLPPFVRVLGAAAHGKLGKSLLAHADEGLAKGEILVAHLGADLDRIRVYDVERHLPLS